jgi:hypothetical protein
MDFPNMSPAAKALIRTLARETKVVSRELPEKVKDQNIARGDIQPALDWLEANGLIKRQQAEIPVQDAAPGDAKPPPQRIPDFDIYFITANGLAVERTLKRSEPGFLSKIFRPWSSAGR